VRSGVTYVVDLLAAIPSVVYGFWALAVLTTPIQHVYASIANSIGTWPILRNFFGGPARGSSVLRSARGVQS